MGSPYKFNGFSFARENISKLRHSIAKCVWKWSWKIEHEGRSRPKGESKAKISRQWTIVRRIWRAPPSPNYVWPFPFPAKTASLFISFFSHFAEDFTFEKFKSTSCYFMNFFDSDSSLCFALGLFISLQWCFAFRAFLRLYSHFFVPFSWFTFSLIVSFFRLIGKVIHLAIIVIWYFVKCFWSFSLSFHLRSIDLSKFFINLRPIFRPSADAAIGSFFTLSQTPAKECIEGRCK